MKLDCPSCAVLGTLDASRPGAALACPSCAAVWDSDSGQVLVAASRPPAAPKAAPPRPAPPRPPVGPPAARPPSPPPPPPPRPPPPPPPPVRPVVRAPAAAEDPRVRRQVLARLAAVLGVILEERVQALRRAIPAPSAPPLRRLAAPLGAGAPIASAGPVESVPLSELAPARPPVVLPPRPQVKREKAEPLPPPPPPVPPPPPPVPPPPPPVPTPPRSVPLPPIPLTRGSRVFPCPQCGEDVFPQPDVQGTHFIGPIVASFIVGAIFHAVLGFLLFVGLVFRAFFKAPLLARCRRCGFTRQIPR